MNGATSKYKAKKLNEANNVNDFLKQTISWRFNLIEWNAKLVEISF